MKKTVTFTFKPGESFASATKHMVTLYAKGSRCYVKREKEPKKTRRKKRRSFWNW